jgi:hypothetical protein
MQFPTRTDKNRNGGRHHYHSRKRWKVARALIKQLELTYVVVQGASQHMSGSFSAWTGGNYFYGFWAGEIFRGLGLYFEWLNAGNTLLD